MPGAQPTLNYARYRKEPLTKTTACESKSLEESWRFFASSGQLSLPGREDFFRDNLMDCLRA